jgi:hypothetical protein
MASFMPMERWYLELGCPQGYEAYPIQVAEYAIANHIDDEPEFAWWVHQVIRRKDCILSRVKSKYWQRTHKFGLRIPKTVEQELALDKHNGNTLWRDAICIEMKNVRPACEKWERSEI